jgi:hypothetical protein
LKTGIVPLQWINIETIGQPPPPRYSHSMNHSEDQNILVIFGGRCDFASKKSKHQQILNDIWILFLENLTWYECKRAG